MAMRSIVRVWEGSRVGGGAGVGKGAGGDEGTMDVEDEDDGVAHVKADQGSLCVMGEAGGARGPSAVDIIGAVRVRLSRVRLVVQFCDSGNGMDDKSTRGMFTPCYKYSIGVWVRCS